MQKKEEDYRKSMADYINGLTNQNQAKAAEEKKRQKDYYEQQRRFAFENLERARKSKLD